MENTTHSTSSNKPVNQNFFENYKDAASNNNTLVAVFKNHNEVDEAVRKLLQSGFDTQHFSVIGRGYHSEETAVGYYNTSDRVKIWGKYGAFWGALWGLLFGGIFMVVPAFGSVVILGPLASMVLSAIEGAILTGGVTALGAALFSIGVPKDSAIKYEEVIKSDGFLLIGHGPIEEINKARDIINQSHPTQMDSFNTGESSQSNPQSNL